ncbi:MAG: HNH endonuclease signature motif containing protein [Oligoflexia bacterium]|nr:HNH endonuclease signature motif containing protein [Oligoflexia bacterium]
MKNLMSDKITELHQKAIKAADNYLRAESELIKIIQSMDQCRGYLELGFRSLFDYTVNALKLSEGVAYNLIVVARKAAEFPQLQDRVRDREITLSNARKIAPVLTQENQEKWLSAAASLSKRELEHEIAKEFPELEVAEKSRYVSEDRLELKMGVSKELWEKLMRAQEIVSTSQKRAASLEDTLNVLLEVYLEKADPVRAAARANKRAENPAKKNIPKQSPVPGKNVRFIPAELKHKVMRRDRGQCTARGVDGKRCPERRWLDAHHIKPIALGGRTTLENLTTLCASHHRLVHYNLRKSANSQRFSSSQAP